MNSSISLKLKRRNPSHKNTLIYLKSAKNTKMLEYFGVKNKISEKF